MHPTTDPIARPPAAGDIASAIPGLAGRLHAAASRLLLGAALLAGALLPSLADGRPFWSTGAFGEGWWLAPAVAIVGLGVALGGLVRLARLLAKSARAGRMGYPLSAVLDVASDRQGERAPLLQGTGPYAALSTAERRWLRHFRVAGALAAAAAGFWALTALALGLFAAGRGLAPGMDLLVAVIVAPTLLLLLLAAACRVLDRTTTRRATRSWLLRQDEGSDVPVWTEETSPDDVVPPAPAPATLLIAAGWAVQAVAVLLALPVLGLAAVMSAGPLLAGGSPGDRGASAARAAGVALFVNYGLPADPAITPQAGGEALHALSHVGRPVGDRAGLERTPARQHGPWEPPGERPESLPPVDRLPGSGTLARSLAGQLSAAELAYLRQVAEHPAQAELAVAGRAAAADLSGARWEDAIRDVAYWELPIGRLAPLRMAAHAGIARAAVEVADGRVAAGEETLRSVLGAGLLLAREATGTLDLITGASMVEAGALALAELFRATGRSAEADGLDNLRRATQLQQALARTLTRRTRPTSSLEWQAATAVDAQGLNPLRWEAVASVNTLAPCFNARSALYGPGASFDEWLEQARHGLVRYPGDESLFAAASRPLEVHPEFRWRGAVTHGLLVVMLGRGAADRCAALVAMTSTLFQ